MCYLLKPFEACSLHLKNRLIMPPMATAKADENNGAGPELLNYYNEKTKGGYFSLVIVEHCYVHERGRTRERQLSISDDSDIPGLRRLASVIRNNGSKCIVQLSHAGGLVYSDNSKMPISPSGVPVLSKESDVISIDGINEVIDAFAKAAVRAKEAGFDGVEIHSAHGYLLNQFYSPITNRRTDLYGGSLSNRIRIHIKIIEAIKQAVGNSYPIAVRLGASDYMEGGVTIEDSIAAANIFKELGVCILDVSGGLCRFDVEGLSGQGYFSPLSEAIKSKVDIPVILTGGISDPVAAEALLEQNKADLIGVGRAVLKDSNWARQAIETMIM